MMGFTHLFVSLALAALVLPVAPEGVAPSQVFLAAVVGGLAPDLDVVANHRRTLHYPVGFPLLACGSGGLALYTGSPAVLLGGVLFGAAALHVFADVLGGSAERAPWDPVTEFGVYNHVLGRWHRPRRLVRYSGSPGDFLLGAGVATLAYLSPVSPPALDAGIVGLLVLAGSYTLARKRLSTLAASLGARLPSRLKRLLPVLQVEEVEGGGTRVAIRLNR